jgi:hypothetical protein
MISRCIIANFRLCKPAKSSPSFIRDYIIIHREMSNKPLIFNEIFSNQVTSDSY